MPGSFVNERFFRGRAEVSARRDEERAAAHRRIEDSELENLLRGAAFDQRLQCLTHEKSREGAWRVEGPTGLPRLASSDERCSHRFVLEDAFVDGAELLDIEVAINDARAC